MLEKNQYVKISKILFELGFNDCGWELKVVHGKTFNPKILEVQQAMALFADKTYHKISDASHGKKPFDAFHTSRVLLVLIWQDIEKEPVTIIDPKVFGDTLLKKTWKYSELEVPNQKYYKIK